jgi:hypothetical protein
MTPENLTALVTGVTGLVASVTGLVALFKHVQTANAPAPVTPASEPAASMPMLAAMIARPAPEVSPSFGGKNFMIATQPGYDATGVNLSHVPADGRVKALYITGSGGVPASAAQLANNPHCVRIDQSPVNTVIDETADILDYENGAAGAAQLAPWVRAALANFHSAKRPGQRSPAIYMSRAKVSEVVNALIAGGVTSGVGLWIADWDFNAPGAAKEVSEGSGPFPVIARQYSDKGGGGLYDLDVWSSPWLANVSKAPASAPVTVPPAPVMVRAVLVMGGLTTKIVNSADGGKTWM